MTSSPATRTRGTKAITLPGSGMSQVEMLRALDDETLTAALEDESFSPALVNAEIRRRQSAAPPAMRGNPRGAAGPGRVPEAPGMDILRNIAGIAGRRRDDVTAGASAADAGIRDIMSGVRNRVGSKIQSLGASFPEVQNPASGLMDRISRNRREARRSEMEPGTTEGDYGNSAPPPAMQLPEGAVAGDYGPVQQDDSGRFDPQPDITAFAGEVPPVMEETARASEDGSVIEGGPAAPSALSSFGVYREGRNPATAGRPFTSHAAAAGLPVAPTPAPRGAASPAAAAADAPGATAAPEPTAAAAAAAETDESQSAYNTASDAARKRIMEILDAQKNAGISDKDRWLSLALGGARMAASRNPYFLGAAGEGAAAGLEDYTAKDKLAKDQARAETGQRLQGEQLAETSGDRAERRVIQKQDSKFKHLDRQDRNAARLDELAIRRRQIDVQIQQGNLTLAQQADLARERMELLKEEGRLNRESREGIEAGRGSVAIQRAQIAAEARALRQSGHTPAEIQIAEVYVKEGKAPDLSTAMMMRKTGVNDHATYQRLLQREVTNVENRYKDMAGRVTKPIEEIEAEALANIQRRASSYKPPAERAAPAAPEPAATGEWGIKKKAE